MIQPPPRYTLLSLHDALPISRSRPRARGKSVVGRLQPALTKRPLRSSVRGGRLQATLRFTQLDDEALEKNLRDRKSTRLNSSHLVISDAVFCLKKKTKLRCEC